MTPGDPETGHHLTRNKHGHWMAVAYAVVGALYVAAVLYMCVLALDPNLSEGRLIDCGVSARRGRTGRSR